MSYRSRVAVTGVGMKTPAGMDTAQVMDTLLEPRPVAARIAEFEEMGLAVTFACRVPDFDFGDYVSARERAKMERTTMLAIAAAMDAIGDTPLNTVADTSRVGVSVGVAAGGLTAAEDLMRGYADRPREVPVFTVPRIMASSPAARISLLLGARGPAHTYATACSSGATAIGEATRAIRSGELDMVVAGGAESALTPMIISSFARIRALSCRNDDPAAACRPFDQDRDGFVMGEGAAFLVLERWEHAQGRGAVILGEILGYGANTDAHHIVAPREDGTTAAECMRLALADAGLAPDDIGHINAHGTATVHNDRAETRAITACFGEGIPPVTAPKGVLGHSLGAAGAVEAVVALTSASGCLVPPVANFEQQGTDTQALDVVAGEPRKIPKMPALSNSFGFGGHNVALVVAPC